MTRELPEDSRPLPSSFSGLLGFTGTRRGMTPDQMDRVARIVPQFSTLLHGACLGADRDAHLIAYRAGLSMACLPSNKEQQDWALYKAPGNILYVAPPGPALRRNRVIAARCSVLLATPAEMQEVLRSGTWATVRYAREAGKPVVIVYPDGRMYLDGETVKAR